MKMQCPADSSKQRVREDQQRSIFTQQRAAEDRVIDRYRRRPFSLNSLRAVEVHRFVRMDRREECLSTRAEARCGEVLIAEIMEWLRWSMPLRLAVKGS